jgi:uncharacterized membrane protein
MHPFYRPSARLVGGESAVAGLFSMAAYLTFWAVAIVMAKREFDARWPRRYDTPPVHDAAVELLRHRLASGEIDVADYRERLGALHESLRGES